MADGKARLIAWLGAAGAAAAVGLTASQEGTVLRSYPDPARPSLLTACIGETHYVVSPGDIVPGATFTEEQCTEALYRSLWTHAEPVIRCGGASLTTNQKIAFLDFNYTSGSFCGSTMAKKARAGDVSGSCAEILRWRFADHGRLDCSVRANQCWGLWERRQKEYARCSTS